MPLGNDRKRIRIVKKIAGLLLAVSTCLAVLPGCSRSSFSRKNVIDVPELARLIVDTMQDIGGAEDYYNRIPEEQKDGVTFSEYYEYVTILQKMMPSGSRIQSFDIVQGEERDVLLSNMSAVEDSTIDDLTASCIPIRVTTTGARSSGVPLYFYLQTNRDGNVYLSHEWVKSCMDLYAFAVHYFEAYTKKNQTDVVSLLPYMDVDVTLLQSPEVLQEKAKEMIRFYSVNVKSTFSEYEMVSIDASDLVYLQPDVLDTQLRSSAREVHFISDENNEIKVVDSVSNELKTADLYLYYDGNRAIRIGESATASQITALFGKPLSITCGPELDRITNDDGTVSIYRNILVRYNGFTITVYGTYTDEDDWEGNYVRFRIWSDTDVSIGTMISVDKSTWDVLKRYPFADASDYVLKIRFDGEDYELSFRIDDSKTAPDGGACIDEIMLTWVRSES